MNIFLWVLQILLALHTLIGAIWKISNPAQIIPSLTMIAHEVWIGMSVIEVFCSVGFILPALAFALPRFRKYFELAASAAASFVMIEMLTFCILHFYSGAAHDGSTIYWSIVGILCAWIAYDRFPRKSKS